MNLKKPNLAQIKDPEDLLSLLVDYYSAFVELDGNRSPSKLPGLKAITAATIAALRKTPGDDSGEAGPRVALLSGGSAVLDGLEGAFAWNSTATARDDSRYVINPNGSKPGRWQRMVWSGVNLALALFTATTDGIVPASGGGTANFLRADGSWAAPSSAGRLLRSPRIITSGASTAATAGCTLAIAKIWAGGGQGGGSAASIGDCGHGGAAGGFAYFATATIPANWTHSIGAGGSSGGTGSPGGAGADTTFSDGVTTVTANGGPGGGRLGASGNPGAAAAISSNGTQNGSSAPGSPAVTSPSGVLYSGSGGSSLWGGAGVGVSNAAGADLDGTSAIARASGGGGAMAGAGITAKTGGLGGNGIVLLWEFS